MLSARIFGLTFLVLTVALYAVIGIQAQSSKTGEQKEEQKTGEKRFEAPPALSPSDTAKPQDLFDSLTQFSATKVGSLSGDIDEIKVARSGNLMWAEAYNKINHLVTDLKARETYFMIVQPKEQCLHHGAVAEQSFPFGFFRPGFKVDRTSAGEAVLDGHHCHVESVVRTGPSGDAVHVKLWEADDLKGFPLKVEVERPGGQVATITYKDVKLGPPDPALFKIPKNCQEGPGRGN